MITFGWMKPDEELACSIKGARGVYVGTSGGHVDWPVRYADGRIAYDFPERVPVRLQQLVAVALQPMEGWIE